MRITWTKSLIVRYVAMATALVCLLGGVAVWGPTPVEAECYDFVATWSSDLGHCYTEPGDCTLCFP